MRPWSSFFRFLVCSNILTIPSIICVDKRSDGCKISSRNFSKMPLRAVGYCFHPWCPDGRAGGRRKIVFPGCISETVRCRKFILGRDIG